MGALSRNKGARGERELAAILREELGADIVRNLEQARDGGCDLIGVDGWAIESKRVHKLTGADLRAWWAQAEGQALSAGKRPVLAFREDRRGWRVVVNLCDIAPDVERWGGYDWTATMSVPAWCALVRERMT